MDLPGSSYAAPDFGVLDFSASSFNLSGQTISGIQGDTLSLNLTEAYFGSTVPGPFEVYLTTNNTVSIAAATSTLRYQTATDTTAPYGVDPQLGAIPGSSGASSNSYVLYDLGQQTYTENSSNYTSNTYTLTLSASAAQAFAYDLSGPGGADVRLVLVAASPTSYPSFSGATTSYTTERPVLSFTPIYSGANNLYWEGASNGMWAATGTTNWNASNTSPGSSAWNNDGAHSAVFAQSTGTTVNVGAGISAAGLEFDSTGYVLNAASNGNTVTLSGSSPYVQVTNATDTATVNIPLAGTAGLNKTGMGTLVLGGANTYTGGTVLTAGTVQISSDSNLGDPSGGITLSGGTLATTGSLSTARAISGNTGGIQIPSGGTVTATGVVNVTNLNMPGAGTLVLANNTFSVDNNSASNAISGTLTFSTAGATLTASSTGTSPSDGQGVLSLGGVNATQTSGNVTVTADTVIAGTVNVNVVNSGATVSLPGNLAGGGLVFMSGSGTLILSGDNSGLSNTGGASFRNGTAATVPTAGGTISIAASNPNPSGALGTGEFYGNGGTISNDTGAPVNLDINGISLGAQNAPTTPGGLVFAGSGAITVNGPISLYKGGSTTYEHYITVNTPTTFTGLLTASTNTTTSLGLTFAGSSTLTLNGTAANTLFEPITIATSGVGSGVIAQGPGTFAANASVTLNAGANLTIDMGQMFSSSEVVAFMATSGIFGKITLGNGSGTVAAEVIGGLYLAAGDGTLSAGYQPAGYYGAPGTPGATYTDPTLFSGSGLIYNEGVATIPEPSSWFQAALAALGLLIMRTTWRRRRWVHGINAPR
jgi:autotransporter-associated beta strand protein